MVKGLSSLVRNLVTGGYVVPVVSPSTTNKILVHMDNNLYQNPCKFIVNWKTTDAKCFISLKNQTPQIYQRSAVYECKFPRCNANYVGKTDRCMLVHPNKRTFLS